IELRWRLEVGGWTFVGGWRFSHARTTLMLCIETMNPPLTPPRRGTVEFWTLDVGRWTLDVGRWTLDVGGWRFSHARTTLMPCIETMNPPLTPPRRGTVEFWTVPLRSATPDKLYRVA